MRLGTDAATPFHSKHRPGNRLAVSELDRLLDAATVFHPNSV